MVLIWGYAGGFSPGTIVSSISDTAMSVNDLSMIIGCQTIISLPQHGGPWMSANAALPRWMDRRMINHATLTKTKQTQMFTCSHTILMIFHWKFFQNVYIITVWMSLTHVCNAIMDPYNYMSHDCYIGSHDFKQWPYHMTCQKSHDIKNNDETGY